jgi:hypothetical protein
MKDLVTLLFVLVLGAGAAGGFFYWKAQEARAEALAYEAAIDDAMDGKFSAVRLDEVATNLVAQGGDLEALAAAYTDPVASDRINLGFGAIRSEWSTTHERLAEHFGREAENGRLQSEIDERLGVGAYTFMADRHAVWIADAPRRAAELEEEARRRNQETARAIDDYLRRHGRLPTGGFRIEYGRVVEDAH